MSDTIQPTGSVQHDGIHGMVPRDKVAPHIRKWWDTHELKKGAPLFKREFGYYCLNRWKEQGMPEDAPMDELFDYDEGATAYLGDLGWCEAAFQPVFGWELIEDRGEHLVIRDFAGRHVLVFKEQPDSFMPEYLDHPVKDRKTWEEDVKWRLDPASPERLTDAEEKMRAVENQAREGRMVVQYVIGGYMYLRSLIGPEDTFYIFYDQPDLVHDCMKTWLELADSVIARHQQHVTIDQLFLAEDICYNHGILISPDMMKEFLFPYYQQLIANLKSRQIDPSRHLYVHIDTDGDARPVIPHYRDAIGMDVMEPFEVASGCDVVEIGRQYPDLVMSGGIDKRVLAQGKKAIDRMVERILPPMRERGGYIPTCDHGVPEEVPYEDYLHYRKRCVELGG